MHTEYLPKLLPTMIDEGQGPGVQFRTDGELVPALTMELDGTMSVFFEHHIVLWKTPSLEIGLHPMKGAFKRAIAGMAIFMTEAKGAGQIAFSRDGVGHVFHLPLAPGQTVEVREHQFLAATANTDYSFRRLRGVANMLFRRYRHLHRYVHRRPGRQHSVAARLRQRLREGPWAG